MKTTRISNAAVPGTLRNQPSMPFATLFQRFLLSLTALLISVCHLIGQSPAVQWTDLDSFKVGYELNSESEWLLPGERFSVKMYLEVDPGFKCLGGTFNIGLDSGIRADLADIKTVPNSWLGEKQDIKSSFVQDSKDGTCSASVERIDNVLSEGSGCVLILHLEMGPDSIPIQDVILSLAGGLIVVDNMDLKWIPLVDETKGIGLGPNPATDWLQVGNEMGLKIEVEIFDIEGRLCLKEQLDPSRKIDLHSIPKGLLLVKIRDRGQNAWQLHRILHR